MTAAAAITTKDFSTVEHIWDLLTMYVTYLVAPGLDPSNQLCSDDFLGSSPHNANLAAKSIIGIATYAALCDATNRSCGSTYMAIARQYADKWVAMSAGGRAGASRRNYDQSATWSQKYNLIWDRVFGFGLFEAAIARECEMIMAPNSTVRQPYGWYCIKTFSL